MALNDIRETPDLETASEDYARRFAGRAGAYLLAEQELAIREALTGWAGGSVLDVGGGHAQLLPIFAGWGSRIVVLGSDIRSLGRIRQRFPRCATAVGDLLELPFADRSFDLVVAVRLVPHVRNWRRLIGELCRVAAHTVVIDYPRIAGFNALTPLLFPLKKRFEHNTRTYRNFRDAELDDVFRSCAFEPTARRAEFMLPMVLHRQLDGARALRGFERLARSMRLTCALGSPVVLRADRIA